MLSISIALNAISTHGTCTAVFVAVAAILTFLLSSIRTLSRMGWIAWIGLVSILSASKWILYTFRIVSRLLILLQSSS